jgi:hypothetical protein
VKTKIVAIGVCPNCGTVFTRSAICTHAICDCSSVVEVPLHPALIMPNKLHAKIKKVADLAGIPLEDFVNALLLEAARKKLKEMKITYRL